VRAGAVAFHWSSRVCAGNTGSLWLVGEKFISDSCRPAVEDSTLQVIDFQSRVIAANQPGMQLLPQLLPDLLIARRSCHIVQLVWVLAQIVKFFCRMFRKCQVRKTPGFASVAVAKEPGVDTDSRAGRMNAMAGILFVRIRIIFLLSTRSTETGTCHEARR